MNIFASLVFWIVVVAIVVIMAIIGYLADKTDLKNKNEKKETGDVPEISPVKSVADETWSDEAKPIDERQEVVHSVSSMDDWSVMPQADDLKETESSNETEESEEETPMFAEMDNNANMAISELPIEPASEVTSEPETAAPVEEVQQVEELKFEQPTSEEAPKETQDNIWG